MQCRLGEWVHLGSTDCIQPDHVAHVKVWAVAAHTSTHSSIFSSPPLTHTPHTHPRHVAVRAHSVHLLVTVVHLFDPLISLHDQSIRHGTHGGGLASRATMTTNTFGSGSWPSVCTYSLARLGIPIFGIPMGSQELQEFLGIPRNSYRLNTKVHDY